MKQSGVLLLLNIGLIVFTLGFAKPSLPIEGKEQQLIEATVQNDFLLFGTL